MEWTWGEVAAVASWSWLLSYSQSPKSAADEEAGQAVPVVEAVGDRNSAYCSQS